MFTCSSCKVELSADSFDYDPLNPGHPLYSFCMTCSDKNRIDDVMVNCTICHRSLPSNYFQHYRTRFKKDGMRLRVNRNCKDCSSKESAIVSKLKRENRAPNYLTECPLCERIVYEKSEDIPDGIDATNGPWQCDHDHKTKKFRGYICKPCNVGVSGDLAAYQRNAPAWKGE